MLNGKNYLVLLGEEIPSFISSLLIFRSFMVIVNHVLIETSLLLMQEMFCV